MPSITRPLDDQTSLTIPCTFLHAVGSPQNLKERVTVWQLPGLDGYGAQRLGKGDAPFGFTAVRYASESVVEGWIIDMEALQGQIVSAVDDWNRAHTNLLVSRVGQPVKTPALSHLGTTRGEVNLFGVTHA